MTWHRVARFVLCRTRLRRSFVMKRVMTMVAACALVLAVVDGASAQTVRFTATLSGASESPAVVTGSFATADVTYDMASQTLSWIIDVFNMPSGTTNAHFHVGGPGAAGPTVVNIAFPAQISNDYRLTGSATAANLLQRADQGIRSWQDLEQSLFGGQLYINVHSTVNPGGEIRGQVLRVQ
jgi:hypothetical protein